MSEHEVTLRIYVEPGKERRCVYAMDSLKRAMRWDETAFGREYDLDIFLIVAVSNFNMGAMENKGLNIFNDKYILASPAPCRAPLRPISPTLRKRTLPTRCRQRRPARTAQYLSRSHGGNAPGGGHFGGCPAIPGSRQHDRPDGGAFDAVALQCAGARGRAR